MRPGTTPRDEVMFIDRDPYGYTLRVKEAIPKRLYPDDINEDSGTEILRCKGKGVDAHEQTT